METKMTDVQQAETTSDDPSKELKIPVTKGKGHIIVNTDKLPDAVYKEAMIQGLKVIANRGMTKITKETYPNPEELKAAAMAQAEKTLEAMYAGKIRIMGAKADKISGVVMTEARRLARALVKDQLKKMGVKVSYVEASEITKAANAYIASNPQIVKDAEASLKERDEKAQATRDALSGLVAAIPQSDKKIKAAEAAKAKAKEVLSKTQAGKVAPTLRARPQ